MNDAISSPPTRVYLVTGMSGAGKTSALKILEDLGYEAIDNIPLSLLTRLLHSGAAREEGAAPRHGAMAVGIDIRTRDFSSQAFLANLSPLMERDDIDLKIVFFDCDEDVLGRRYTETRRRHPLAEDRPLIDGIRHERELLAPLRARANIVIDTSEISLADFRRDLFARFQLDGGPELTASLVSFAYGKGLPREADLVFDVRFLANPHYDENLRARTGQDADVAAFIAADPNFPSFIENLSTLLFSLMPLYEREGKTYLTIAVGCTGGRHRSVFVAEHLAKMLEAKGPVMLRHRDLGDAERQNHTKATG